MILGMERLRTHRVRDPLAREARLVLYRVLHRAGMVTAGFADIAKLYDQHGRGRRFRISPDAAASILSRNGAGWGLSATAHVSRVTSSSDTSQPPRKGGDRVRCAA